MIFETGKVVVLQREEYQALAAQIGRRRQAEKTLREANAEIASMLLVALHQLAQATGKKDHSHFARRWIAQQRQRDTQGINFVNGSGA